MHALIAGGSLGGLFAAALLRREGWDVTVCERSAERLSGRGAGIVSHPPLVAALARAGCPDAALGVSVPGRVVFGADGGVLGRRDRPQVLTSWSRLHALLVAAVPEPLVHHGARLLDYTADADGVVARFADGTERRADVLVGADGIRSAVRARMHPAVRPRYAGYIAWRGLVDEAALSPATHAALFDRFAFSLPDDEQMLGYPIAGEDDDLRPGRRRYNFVWYRPAGAAALADLLTDGTGRHHPDGIPPAAIRPALTAAMREDADGKLGPQFAEVVRGSPAPFVQPILDLEVPCLVDGPVALLGDAAFVARPHVGMGVTKAAQDAMALADALGPVRTAGEVGPALRRYDASRQAVDAAIVARARMLGAYMEATATPGTVGQAHRTPDAVMAETAWMGDA